MSITFTHPYYLWGLLLLPLVWGLALTAPRPFATVRQRLSLFLRTLVLLCAVLALSGMELRRPVDNLTVVFLVDVSDSMPSDARDQATAYVRQAIENMPDGDQAAVVLFGREALVERTASDLRRLDNLASVPLATRTDIADAIQLGLALFPNDMHKRLVLISDGQQNEGDALVAADLAAARDVVLDTVTLGGGTDGPEAQITVLEAPNSVAQGQRFELVVRLNANVDTTGRLRVFGDASLLFDEQVTIPAGASTVRIPIEATGDGFEQYRAVLDAAADNRPQNNEATAYTEITGPPRVAVITNEPDEAAALVEALESSNMSVTVLPPNGVPQELAGLLNYDSLVLVGVKAPELPPATMELIPTYVRDLGYGLVMIGGPEGFGAGQYIRTPIEEALPVDMEVRPRDQQANIAIVLAVDKSGSMGRCHCDDPNNGQQQQQRRESGLPKVDIAKDAIIQATAALGETDYVGVVAFDSAARWALETQRFPGIGALEEAVAPINADGPTNIFAGLSQAEQSLVGIDARVKHIILLTDGWSRAGDYQALADRLAEEGITLSVVAAGSGSAQDLDELAQAGGGRYYPAANMEEVPQIFLQETIRIAGRYIIEEPFYPTLMNTNSSILTGLPLEAGAPALIGYNGTTIKPDANEVLRTSQGDPLLATRRYGIGRTVAWTSDLSNRWAGEWLAWGGFRPFAAQLVGWSLPDPQTGNLQVRSRAESSVPGLTITARDDDNRPINATTTVTVTGPDLDSIAAPVTQVGAGDYQATLPSDQPGVYYVTVTQRDAEGNPISTTTRGIVVPYSPEYRLQTTDESTMARLAQRTEGQVRSFETIEGLFEQPPFLVQQAQALWPALLTALILLFPLDVAVRRVLVGQRELTAARGWMRERLTRRNTVQPAAPKELGTLFEAKERATRRESRPTPPGEGATPGVTMSDAPPANRGTVVLPTIPLRPAPDAPSAPEEPEEGG